MVTQRSDRPATATDTVDWEDVILRADTISKVFPGTLALDRVTFDVHRGKVNVLVGENGAGKSTLMKILAGADTPTHGRVLLDGDEITLRSPLDAVSVGIGIIYQELNLCANLSVVDNIFLGREMLGRGFVDRKAERDIAAGLLERLEQDIDVDDTVGDLRIGQQQIVEIAKALAEDARILIMDEPTSALSAVEVDVLFRLVRELRSLGVSIIYISHKLDEVMEIGDTITVLRDGRVVARSLVEDVDITWVVDQMVGGRAESMYVHTEREFGDPLLRVQNLCVPRIGGGYLVDHVSFELRAGEILGFYGLMGAGRSDLVDALIGDRPEASGRIWLGGEELQTGSVAGRIKAGLALVPEDRQRDGLVPTLSVIHNMSLASLESYVKRVFLSPKEERAAADRLINELSIRTADPRQLVSSLSGGNQQKVVVAKGLLTNPRVLMLDEPTRGIDVGTKAEIFDIASRLAGEGYGVLLISSELKEILAMADRIIVMSKGVVTGEFTSAEATEDKLVAASAVGHRLADRAGSLGVRNGA